MSTPKIYDFADLGAALERLEKAKSPASADVPEPVINHYPAPDWADIYTGKSPMAVDIIASGGAVYAQCANGRAAAWGWPER